MTLTLLTIISAITAPQPDSLPGTPVLFTAIDSFWTRHTAAQLTEFTDSRKDDWMLWLPGAGITYTLSGSPRPTLSYSLHELFNARKSRQEKAAKRRVILETNRLNAEKDKTAVKALLRRHQLLQADAAATARVLETQTQIFRIYEQEYLRGEMTPTEFLPKKAQYEERIASLAAKTLQIGLLEIEIMEKAHAVQAE
jgi:hypothetical protein